MTALGSAYVVLDVDQGDLDGDGAPETVACYRENLATTDQAGGVIVLRGRGPEQRPVFQVQLDRALCEQVGINGRKLGVLLRNKKQLVWTYGEDLHFTGEKGALVRAQKVSASSQTDNAHAADKAFDNNLSTSWAEGKEGTGIGQSVTIRLERPVDVAAVGLFCGDGSGTRAFFDKNRVHRGSIEVKTEADLGDSAAGFDFASLGIDTIGDRVEFTCENRPEVKYVRLNKRGAVEVQIRIDSVYLGDKSDDTHIAEVEIIPRLGPSQTLDKATRVVIPVKPEASPGDSGSDDDAEEDTDPSSAAAAEAAARLDGDGRGIDVSDDW